MSRSRREAVESRDGGATPRILRPPAEEGDLVRRATGGGRAHETDAGEDSPESEEEALKGLITAAGAAAPRPSRRAATRGRGSPGSSGWRPPKWASYWFAQSECHKPFGRRRIVSEATKSASESRKSLRWTGTSRSSKKFMLPRFHIASSRGSPERSPAKFANGSPFLKVVDGRPSSTLVRLSRIASST